MGGNNASFDVFGMNKEKHRRRLLNLPAGNLAFGRILGKSGRLYYKAAAKATVGTR